MNTVDSSASYSTVSSMHHSAHHSAISTMMRAVCIVLTAAVIVLSVTMLRFAIFEPELMARLLTAIGG